MDPHDTSPVGDVSFLDFICLCDSGVLGWEQGQQQHSTQLFKAGSVRLGFALSIFPEIT